MTDSYKVVWDNAHIYKGLEDPKLQADFEEKVQCFEKLELGQLAEMEKQLTQGLLSSNAQVNLDILEESLVEMHEIGVDLYEIYTFVRSVGDTDNKNQIAKEWEVKCQKILYGRMSEGHKTVNSAIKTLTDEQFRSFVVREKIEPFRFGLERERLNKAFSLSIPEEKILASMAIEGLIPWGNLHRDLSARVAVKQENGEMKSFSQLKGDLYSDDENIRKKSYLEIEQGFQEQLETCAACLNGISGWRLTENKKRSHTKEKSVLDNALHVSRLTEKTLDTMLNTVQENVEVGRRALRSMAKYWGKGKLDPWDLLGAPVFENNSSSSNEIKFAEAIDLISEAVGKVDSEMGTFCKMMAKKGWIDAAPSTNKREGGYCTGFFRSREPRIFMTFNGTMGAVMTLAHELGHAYHNWVLKSLPRPAVLYPATLAETASIFTETLVSDQLLANCKENSEKLGILWQQASNAIAFLVNIPVRFQFEKEFYEQRKTRILSASQISELNKKHWEIQYGDTLNAHDQNFWATKLHFYMTGMEFYNFPYTFGYLFALGIYGRKDEKDFKNIYHNLLLDTGRMTCEEVAKTHLDADLEDSSFWQSAIDQAKIHVDQFALAVES